MDLAAAANIFAVLLGIAAVVGGVWQFWHQRHQNVALRERVSTLEAERDALAAELATLRAASDAAPAKPINYLRLGLPSGAGNNRKPNR